MRREQNSIFTNIDWILILLYIILVSFGWVNIYASTITGENYDVLNFSTIYGKQLIWIILSIPLIVLILFIHSKFFEQLSGTMYIVSLVSLVGVLIFGKTINNATSWYSFGSFSIQPSELAKAFTALGLASLMSNRQYNLKSIKNIVKALVVIFTPAILIMLQPDMGSVLVYFAFIFVLNREGLNSLIIPIGMVIGILFIVTIYFGFIWTISGCFVVTTIYFLILAYKKDKFLKHNWFMILLSYITIGLYVTSVPLLYEHALKKHQRDRIEILLGQKVDNSDTGYNSHQSILTVSSGGLVGKGFLQGDRTQGDFVPENHTDYIFSVVAEEWGFLGAVAVILIFTLFILRIIYLSEKTPSKFGRIYGYSTAAIFFFHVLINIAMVIGLFPTVGIPLPFFSYGGSGLWGFTILLFIFIRLDSNKENEY